MSRKSGEGKVETEPVVKRESPPATLHYETRRARARGPTAHKLTVLEIVGAAIMLAIVSGLIAALFAFGS